MVFVLYEYQGCVEGGWIFRSCRSNLELLAGEGRWRRVSYPAAIVSPISVIYCVHETYVVTRRKLVKNWRMKGMCL